MLLKENSIKLPEPNNFYVEDVVIYLDVAIFATSKLLITNRSPYNTSDQQEDVMMASRSKMFSVHHQFTEGEQTLNELPTSYQHVTVHVTAHLIGF